MTENDKWIRYRCDNPNCTSGIKGGGFFIKDGPCPYCGSEDYHSFNAHPKHIKKVIDDIIKYSPELINPEKEGKMLYFKINCPFCEGNSVSDVIDSIEEVDGQWECSNGHQFVVKYLGKIE